MSKIARASLTVTFFTLGGLGLSFLSNVVIAASFGASSDMDLFLAATTLPLFITNILSSSLNYTFIPVFAKYREKAPEETWKMVSSFINLNALAALAACLAGFFFALPIMQTIAPGFSVEELARSAELLRWLLPIIVFTVVNELMASVYYSNNRFAAPSLNKIISPALTMAYVYFFHATMSTKSIALAMLTASALQTLVLAAGFFRDREFRYFPSLDFRHPGVRETLKLMLPLVIGMLAYRAAPLFDRFFLSSLGEGSISHIGYATKVLGVISTVVTAGISVAIFPRMAHYASRGETEHLTAVLAKGMRMLIFLSMPFIFVFGIFGRPLIGLVFERGRFTPADTTAVCAALALYLLSMLPTSVGTVVAQGFYVLRENVKVAVIGTVMVVPYIALCVLLTRPMGYLGVPMAYAIYLNLDISVMLLVLRKKLPGLLRGIPGYVGRTALIAGAACLPFYPAYRLADDIWLKALAGPSAFAGYIALAFFFKLQEPALIKQMVLDRIRGRFPKIVERFETGLQP